MTSPPSHVLVETGVTNDIRSRMMIIAPDFVRCQPLMQRTHASLLREAVSSHPSVADTACVVRRSAHWKYFSLFRSCFWRQRKLGPTWNRTRPIVNLSVKTKSHRHRSPMTCRCVAVDERRSTAASFAITTAKHKHKFNCRIQLLSFLQ